MTQRTVLYVEDSDWDRFLMEVAFRNSGLESWLRVACDGAAAIEYLAGRGGCGDRKENPVPVLVLLDLNLPGVSGF